MTPTPCFKVTPFFHAEYLRNKTYRHSFNEILIGTYYSTVSFQMTLSDLEWLSKIFNDTKRRSVSLRPLSFLFIYLFSRDISNTTEPIFTKSVRKMANWLHAIENKAFGFWVLSVLLGTARRGLGGVDSSDFAEPGRLFHNTLPLCVNSVLPKVLVIALRCRPLLCLVL